MAPLVGEGTLHSIRHIGGYGSPKLVMAQSATTTTVRCSFDQPMKRTNPTGTDDVTNPALWTFGVVGGISVNAVSVAVFQAEPTIVDITLDSEMTLSAAYSVTVDSAVKSVTGQPVDPGSRSYSFTGLGVLPQVSAATVPSTTSIQIDFSEDMLDNAALVDTANYVISGYASIPVSNVTRSSATRVTLTIPPNMKTGESYTVTVSNVEDLAQNPIDPANNSAGFTGVGQHPKLISTALPIDPNTIEIQFDKDVQSATAIDAENYDLVKEGSVPVELKKWWEFTGTEALHCKAAAEDSYDPGAQSFTLVASVELDTNVSQRFFDKTEMADGYRLGTNASGELEAIFWKLFLPTSDVTTGNAIPTGEEVIVALRYTLGTATLEALFVDSGGLKSTGGVLPTPAPGNTPELLKLNSQFDGKVRWSAMYFGTALSNMNLAHMYLGAVHPWDLSPTVYIDYHKLVGAVYQPEVPYSSGSNYYFDVIGTPTRVGITEITPDTYRLVTGEQSSGVLHTLTVLPPAVPYPTGVLDPIGNPCLTPNNVATFSGIGVSPPLIVITPPDGTRNVTLRTPLQVQFADNADDFTGIDESSLWVKVSYTDENGIAQEIYAVKDGSISSHFTGTKTGDPLDADGVLYSVLPRAGRWQESTDYTIQAFGRDLEQSSNSDIASFRTDSPTCFEDLLPGAETIDTQILTPLAGPNIEKLRQVLLASCSQSALAEVRARTVLYIASMTDLRTTVAGTFDFNLVDSIKLCERKSTLSVYQALLPYWRHVAPALNEIPNLTTEALQLLKQYTESTSLIYAVNAVAAAVVLAASQTA